MPTTAMHQLPWWQLQRTCIPRIKTLLHLSELIQSWTPCKNNFTYQPSQLVKFQQNPIFELELDNAENTALK